MSRGKRFRIEIVRYEVGIQESLTPVSRDFLRRGADEPFNLVPDTGNLDGGLHKAFHSEHTGKRGAIPLIKLALFTVSDQVWLVERVGGLPAHHRAIPFVQFELNRSTHHGLILLQVREQVHVVQENQLPR